MGDEQCFQTTAPDSWFGWALAAGLVAAGATVVALALWLPRRPESLDRSRGWKHRVLASVPGVALVSVSFLNLWRLGPSEAVEMVRQSLVPVLLIAPFLGLAVWRDKTLRRGGSLTHGQRVVLAGARVVTTVTAVGAAMTAIGLFAAYMASAVQVDCSTIPR